MYIVSPNTKYLNLQNNSNGKNAIRICVVFLLFLSLLINNLSATNSINLNKSYSFLNTNKIEKTNTLNSFCSTNYTTTKRINYEYTLKNTETIILNLDEIFELFETEIDYYVETISKDYKFYYNFIIKSIDLDRFSLNQAKTIPLYILFHCLKIHLS